MDKANHNKYIQDHQWHMIFWDLLHFLVVGAYSLLSSVIWASFYISFGDLRGPFCQCMCIAVDGSFLMLSCQLLIISEEYFTCYIKYILTDAQIQVLTNIISQELINVITCGKLRTICCYMILK